MTPRLEREKPEIRSCDACGCQSGDPHPAAPDRRMALRVASRHSLVDVCETCLQGATPGSFRTLEDLVLAASSEEQQRIFARLADSFAI